MPSNSKEYRLANYKKYWGTSKALKDRAKRNAARKIMEKKWLVSKWDWKEVDHKKWVAWWNGGWNLRVLSRTANRILWQKKATRSQLRNNKKK